MIISPLSTIVLESIIQGIPIVAYAGKDRHNKWGADQMKNLEHFKEMIENKKLISWCDSLDDIVPSLKESLHQTVLGNHQD